MAKETMVLYGKNSVRERLKADPASVRKVCMTHEFAHEEIEELIRAKGITLERHTPKELGRMRPEKDLQGVLAHVDKYRYAAFPDVLARGVKQNDTLVFLDRINDPQNLGVIMRGLACLGGFAVVIPEFKSCEVNETVVHVASGAENYVPVARVANLTNAMLNSRKAGYWLVGAVVDEGAQDITALSLPFPLGLVLGSEGEGLRYGVDKHLDIRARIPMVGAPLSFNVAMACVVLGYEITRQRGASS